MRHYDSGFTSFGRFLLLWLGVGANEAMIRNLSLILEDMAESTAKAKASRQKSLESLNKIAVDSRIALDYPLVQQGGICAVANTTCCTWINTSGKVKTQLHQDHRTSHLA